MNKKIKGYVLVGTLLHFILTVATPTLKADAIQVSPSHIGTFEGTTTFTTISENDAMPSLFIEVKNQKGELTQYYSEEGIITIPNTSEGTYITQAKMFGRTLFQDVHTRELLTERDSNRTLELVSPQNPRLTITTNNLIVLDDWVKTGNDDNDQVVTLTKLETSTNSFEAISNGTGYGIGFIVRVPEDGVYKLNYEGENVHLHIWRTNSSAYINLENTPLQKGETLVIDFKATLPGVIKATNLSMTLTNQTEPISYKSSVIRSNQTFNLRQIRENRDEWDLMSGELTKRISEVRLDGGGDEKISIHSNKNEYLMVRVGVQEHPIIREYTIGDSIMSDKLSKISYGEYYSALKEGVSVYEGTLTTENLNIYFTILKSRLGSEDLNGLKSWLQSNPLTIQYRLQTPITQQLSLNYTYTFPPVAIHSMDVSGNIYPTIISLSIPSDSLSFSLNPNQEEGQQFIVPTFSIFNENYAPLSVELKEFKQTTQVFRDVLPNHYESWEGLNQEESKHIALSITPQPSEGWLDLNEKSYYVANHSPQTIGTIKGKSSVEFTFSALHGISFAEPLTPQYQLTFMFDLLD